MEAIADALEPIAAEVDGLQVYPYLNSNPTPPSLDIYPGAPFQTGAGFGVGQSQVWFTIRARVRTADQEAAMKLLLRMMDPNDPAIVEAAIADTAAVTPEGVSRVPRIPRGLSIERPAVGLRMEGEHFPMTKTKYKALAAFQGHQPGDEFEADLDPTLERRATERGQIKKVNNPTKKEEKADG